MILIFGFAQGMCHFAGDSVKLFGEGVIISTFCYDKWAKLESCGTYRNKEAREETDFVYG